MIIPGTDDLVIFKGASFNPYWIMDIDGVPVDLSAYTAIFVARLATGNRQILITLTTENGGIELDDDGKIQLNMSASQTDALIFKGDGVYNLELINGEEVDRILQGGITLDLGTID